jgi:amidophosphoribosyltransferase
MEGTSYNPEQDKLGHECGVYGAFFYENNQDIANHGYKSIFTLQHRGQDAAGVAVSDGKNIQVLKGKGEISEALSPNSLAGLHSGNIVSCHVRYGTSKPNGDSPQEIERKTIAAIQPIYMSNSKGQFTLVDNGHAEGVEEKLRALGNRNEVITDSIGIAHMVSEFQERTGDLITATCEALPLVQDGAFSLIIMDNERLIGARDPQGYRPLVLGELPEGQGMVLASETPALDIHKARYVRSVDPGEVIVIDKEGMRSYYPFEKREPTPCVFENFYISRPDSKLPEGDTVYQRRHESGRLLAKQLPTDADLVVPVPDSGKVASIGYAKESGIEWAEALQKNRYVPRTFIKATQSERASAVRMKFNPIENLIDGKRLVVVDDSVVRGTSSLELVRMLRDAGAKEIHLRLGTPPVISSCYYGIDTGDPTELLANNMTLEQMRFYLGVDTLDFLSIENMHKANGTAVGKKACDACFTGNYPSFVPGFSKINREKRLPLVTMASSRNK